MDMYQPPRAASATTIIAAARCLPRLGGLLGSVAMRKRPTVADAEAKSGRQSNEPGMALRV